MRRSPDAHNYWRLDCAGELASSRSLSASAPIPLILILCALLLLLGTDRLLHADEPDDEVVRSSGLFGTDEDFTLSYDQLEVDVEDGGGGPIW
ncbi:MAG TPA: hypothetical protein EYN79_11070 [Planctomycetes bacterium]|nr:hypothetical protein [Planctomycetota bacterium]